MRERKEPIGFRLPFTIAQNQELVVRTHRPAIELARRKRMFWKTVALLFFVAIVALLLRCLY